MLKFLKKNTGLIIFLLYAMSLVIDSAFAKETSGGNTGGGTPAISDPATFILLATGGAILVGIRRWKSKK
ncbi:MAG: hypothetical protein MRJ65_02605 [Candidatus Brocadiaceae bacterium]|nr:hypothetical protein [Candidatus Brocadiaceae bacterium]